MKKRDAESGGLTSLRESLRYSDVGDDRSLIRHLWILVTIPLAFLLFFLRGNDMGGFRAAVPGTWRDRCCSCLPCWLHILLLAHCNVQSQWTAIGAFRSGDWSTSTNWGGTEPGSNDVAYVTNGGTATVTDAGEICDRLYVGNVGNEKGTVNITGGDLTSFLSDVGVSGTGSVNQSAGTNSVSGHLTLGCVANSKGYYDLSDTGQLFANCERIGLHGRGTLTQYGGTNIVSTDLELGYQTVSYGTYRLGGTGQLFTSNLLISRYGGGNFIHSGGTNTVSNSLELGLVFNSDGSYRLSESGRLFALDELVGSVGTGWFFQAGGTNTVTGSLHMGRDSGSKGTYNLTGGVLALKSIIAGSGTATFNFGGGTICASDTFSASLPMNLSGVNGNANVNTNGCAVTLDGILSGVGGLTKAGLVTLSLTAANDYGGPTTVTAGTIELGPAAQNVVFTLGGADIQSGKMLFDCAGGSSPAATILDLLSDSYSGGLWNVGQFRDSTAGTTGLTLGWLDDPAVQAVTVMATYPGDFNLDGVADAADMEIMVSHIGRWGDWGDGDANYDGRVDILDWNAWKASRDLPPLDWRQSRSGARTRDVRPAGRRIARAVCLQPPLSDRLSGPIAIWSAKRRCGGCAVALAAPPQWAPHFSISLQEPPFPLCCNKGEGSATT